MEKFNAMMAEYERFNRYMVECEYEPEYRT